MFLMYYLVNQAVLELHVVQLIVMIFHCGRRFKLDIALSLRSN